MVAHRELRPPGGFLVLVTFKRGLIGPHAFAPRRWRLPAPEGGRGGGRVAPDPDDGRSGQAGAAGDLACALPGRREAHDGVELVAAEPG